MQLRIDRYLKGRIAADFGVASDKRRFIAKLLRYETQDFFEENVDWLMGYLSDAYVYLRCQGCGEGGVQIRKPFPAKEVEMPDQFEPAPAYEYPVENETFATSYRRAYEVTCDWEGRLHLLSNGSSVIDEDAVSNIRSFVQWLCDQCGSNERWQVLGDGRYSNDEVTEFIKKPTATALAILVLVKRKYPDVVSQVPELAPLIQTVSRQIFERGGYKGHGHDTWSDMAVILASLAAGGVISEWFQSPDFYPGLKDRLIGLRDDMVSAPQNWCCFNEIGFSFITVDELNFCIRHLDPFQELGAGFEVKGVEEYGGNIDQYELPLG